MSEDLQQFIEWADEHGHFMVREMYHNYREYLLYMDQKKADALLLLRDKQDNGGS